MDSPKLEMLKTEKGKDMLLINDYLYHYDDCYNETYRWVCSRRRDSIPCRVRIFTTLTDERDLTRYKVESILGEHSHGPADQGAILRARERKRLADAEVVLPCTLGNNPQKRKYESQSDKKNLQMNGKSSGGNTSDNSEEDVMNDIIVMDDVVKVMPQTANKHAMILQTTKGYRLIAVEGCIYILDGKSMFSSAYRWKCFRSTDLQCTGRIYTECLANGMHHFQPFRVEENKHNHQPYRDAKIDAMIKRNNMKILQGISEIPAIKAPPRWDEKKPKGITSKGVAEPLAVQQFGGHVSSISADINPSLKASFPQKRTQATSAMYRCVEDPYDALSKPKDGDVTKFFFLPSLRGKLILVLDNMVFHLDSRGTFNERAFWSCKFKKYKKIKCICRLTTENTGASTQIVKFSGDHTHAANHREHIEIRLKKYNTMKGMKALIEKNNNVSIEDDGDSFDIEENYGEQEANEGDTADPSEFLKIKVMQRGKESLATATNVTSTLDDQEYSAVEYLEMEAVNTSQFHADYEFEQLQDKPTLCSGSQRPIRKIRMPLKYRDDNDAELQPPTMQPRQQSMLGQISRNTPNISSNPDNIDIIKASKIRSAKGEELLCADGYTSIYHLKSSCPQTLTYWDCIKSKDRNRQCAACVSTITTEENKLKMAHISNMEQSLSELNPKFTNILGEYNSDVKRDKKVENGMKLYAVSDSPPSLAVRMCLKALNLPYKLHNMDDMNVEYAKINPQKEIPVLDDDGFFLSHSVAIMQYLCDKYAMDTSLYPTDAKQRALINHRLYFNMDLFYSSIGAYAMAPKFFKCQRTQMGLTQVNNALSIFEAHLKGLGAKYAAGNNVTIADFALVSVTLCLEAIGFDLTPYPLIKEWYEGFKNKFKTLWKIANDGMQKIMECENKPPHQSLMNYTHHPTRNAKTYVTGQTYWQKEQ